jgi:hypothetical protein
MFMIPPKPQSHLIQAGKPGAMLLANFRFRQGICQICRNLQLWLEHLVDRFGLQELPIILEETRQQYEVVWRRGVHSRAAFVVLWLLYGKVHG